MYQVTTDEQSQPQIDALPPDALAPFAEARVVLEVTPWGGDSRGGGPGGLGGTGGGQAQRQIESWVSSHFKSQTVGGVKLYDLTTPKSS